MTLWAVKTSKLAMYLGQEDTQGYGFTASPSPPFLWQSSTSVLPWLPDQGQGCRGSRQAGGPGKAEDSNRKEPTGAQRTVERDGGGERPPTCFFKPAKFRKSNIPKLQFRICRLWRMTCNSGEQRRTPLSYRRLGSWGNSSWCYQQFSRGN